MKFVDTASDRETVVELDPDYAGVFGDRFQPAPEDALLTPEPCCGGGFDDEEEEEEELESEADNG